MVETHVLPLPSYTLSLNQCYGDSWCSLAMEESFYFCFRVWVSVCVWDCVPNIQGMFGRDPRALPPLVAADLSPLSLLFYFIFSLFLFCFSSSWFGSWSIYGLGFLMVIRIRWFFIWVWKVGFTYGHFRSMGIFWFGVCLKMGLIWCFCWFMHMNLCVCLVIWDVWGFQVLEFIWLYVYVCVLWYGATV